MLSRRMFFFAEKIQKHIRRRLIKIHKHLSSKNNKIVKKNFELETLF